MLKTTVEGDPAASSSSSSEYSDDEDGERPKKLPRLALPGAIAGLFQREEEDSSAHQGRKRRVPHVDGNFATHVTLPIQPDTAWRNAAAAAKKIMETLLSTKQAEVHSFEEQQWHVSLSPLLMLRLHFIDPFLDGMRDAVKGWKASNTLSEISFDPALRIFAAKDFSRFFIGLAVTKSSCENLKSLLGSLEGAASSFGLQGDDSWASQQPHCSLVWTLDDLRPALKASGAKMFESAWGVCWQLDSAVSTDLPTSMGHLICVKVGKRITEIPL